MKAASLIAPAKQISNLFLLVEKKTGRLLLDQTWNEMLC